MPAKVLDGRYKLIKALGEGGFGRTYIARDMRRPGAPPCVVKQLKPASDDPSFIREARRLFNTEAETLEKLGKHDRIPQLLAYFEENNQFFLVQEFIEGHPLQYELAPPPPQEPQDGDEPVRGRGKPILGKQLSEPEVVAILKDVLDILEFVHAEGVIHRDIKPDNLIRRKKDGKLVLIDFGAVKALQEGAQIETVNGESRFTVTIGTPGYMPSEQCAGRPTFSSDIYALGTIAIQALTGNGPIDLPSDPDTGEIRWRNRAKVSNGLAMVLTRMVRYHYTQRYQSAKEVLQGLAAFSISEEARQEARQETSIVKSTTSAPSRTVVKSQTQSNSGSWLLIGGLLAMVGITAIAISSLTKSNQQPVVISSPLPTTSTTTPPTPEVSATPIATPVNSSTPTPPAASATTGDFSQSLSPEIGKETLREGDLKSSQILTYTFSGKEGQKFKAELAGDNISMSVLGQNKEPIDSKASQTLTWEGSLPVTGDYQVQIKPHQGVAQSTYKLKVLLGEEQTLPTRSVDINVKPSN